MGGEYEPQGKRSPSGPGDRFGVEGRDRDPGRAEYLNRELRQEGNEALRHLKRVVEIYERLVEGTGSEIDRKVLDGLKDALTRIEGAVKDPSELMRALEREHGISSFFISYSRRDEAPMRELYRQLQSQGARETFLDIGGVRGLGVEMRTSPGSGRLEPPKPSLSAEPAGGGQDESVIRRSSGASRGLGVGVEWKGEIDRAVGGTDALIVVFSRGVIDKPDQVCREVILAAAAGKQVFPFADTREVLGGIRGLKGHWGPEVDRALDHILSLNVVRLPEGSLLEEMIKDPKRTATWMLSEIITGLRQKKNAYSPESF